MALFKTLKDFPFFRSCPTCLFQGKGVMTTYWLDSEIGRKPKKSTGNPQVDQLLAEADPNIDDDPQIEPEAINQINKIISP